MPKTRLFSVTVLTADGQSSQMTLSGWTAREVERRAKSLITADYARRGKPEPKFASVKAALIQVPEPAGPAPERPSKK